MEKQPMKFESKLDEGGGTGKTDLAKLFGKEQPFASEDSIREALNNINFIDKPISEWTEQEKEYFSKIFSRFNNFLPKLQGCLRGLREDGVLVDNIIDLKKLSEKEGTYDGDLIRMIVKNNVNIEELIYHLDKLQELYHVFIALMNRNQERAGMTMEEYFEKNRSHTLPVFKMMIKSILDMFDSGYKRTELSV